jgi:hypothetical protein
MGSDFMAFFILATYCMFASAWMFYMTDGDVRQLRVFMAGVTSTAVGTWLAMYLSKRKKDERQ